MDDLIDTWRINNRINLYMLGAIAEEALTMKPPIGGRNVAQQWMHLHNARRMWVEAAAKELLPEIEKLDTKASLTKTQLAAALSASGEVMERILGAGLESGRVKGFKPHPAAFLGYLVAHDSYHRAEIGIILKQVGHPLDQKTSYGMWEWGVR